MTAEAVQRYVLALVIAVLAGGLTAVSCDSQRTARTAINALYATSQRCR